ncbi:MAG: D-glycero-beta-D-manno-heptose 1-phosphate adenylyltransferase [Nocardioidaceae bacterium]|nr:D-glycero-beta-D-manno-heptose 1-phosphate adenylyltransferase [Nocardioidaceae bacterium]
MKGPLVVVGDALLDIDVVGRAERLSPDAPVPVLDSLVEHARPGGAALAALMAARDGHDVVLITAIGADAAGQQLRELLGDIQLIEVAYDGPTPVKRRVRAGRQPIARLDSGSTVGRYGEVACEAAGALAGAASVLVSDYGRGLTSVAALRDLLAERSPGIPSVWDPHPRGASPVAGIHLVTPNLNEARAWASRHDAAASDEMTPLARTRADATILARAWQPHAVVVTMGARGALLSYADGTPMVTPAPDVHCVDPCGAGDRFAVSAAVALGSGELLAEAVHAAVMSASAYVAAGGPCHLSSHVPPVVAWSPRQLPPKITSLSSNRGQNVAELLESVRRHKGIVVATGGCFDVVHAGHVATLEAARRLGDCLVVCLNSDASVRRLKGHGRPLVSMADRALVLNALGCVDAVVIFDEDTPVTVLRQLRPDLWVKGGDYAGHTMPETAVLETWGGQTVALPYVRGHSTTQLVRAAASSTQHPSNFLIEGSVV